MRTDSSIATTRHALRLFGALVLPPVMAQAQGFTGTIEARFAKDSLAAQVYTLSVRGDQWHGFLRDEEKRPVVFMMLLDGKTRALREAGYVQGTVSAESVAEPLFLPLPGAPPALRPLGKQQKIAGHPCDTYAFDVAGRAFEGCFTAALGRVVTGNRAAPDERMLAMLFPTSCGLVRDSTGVH